MSHLQEEIQHLVRAYNYYWRQGFKCFPMEHDLVEKQRREDIRWINEQLDLKLKVQKYFCSMGRYFVKYIGQWPLADGQTHPSCHILEVAAPNGFCSRENAPILFFAAMDEYWQDDLAQAEPISAARYYQAVNRVLEKGKFEWYAFRMDHERKGHCVY